MAGLWDEDRPSRPVAHEIGQDLAALSVGDIDLRIAALEAEISRLREARAAREATRNAAGAFFKG